MNKLGLVMVVALGACGDNRESSVTVDASPDAANLAERGQYIMNVLGACTFCHTPLLPNGMRDQTKLLAGVDCFFDAESPDGIDDGDGVGCLSTRNLTNHSTGLANATDAQIQNAFRNGIRTDDKKLAPVMPYWIFHNMTDEDADAVVAYLRTVPGVDHQVKANEPPWSMFNDGTIPMTPFVNPDLDIPMPRGGVNNTSAMRGRYLSSMAGLCIDCHTPEVAPPNPVPLDFTRAFGGGRAFPKGALGLIDPSYPDLIVTRNITPSADGTMGWTKDQIKAAIKDGKDKNGTSVCAATHGAQISPYAALTAQDLDDIAEYLMQIPPLDHNPYTVDGTATGNPKDCGFAGGTQDCTNCAGPPVP